MPIVFNRTTYFNMVRDSLFAGKMLQQQVEGQEFILDTWEDVHPAWDVRWLAYALATTIHETGSAMWPVEENGKGKGQPYGVPDPVTGETYYGRGFVQLTWKDNYQKMTPIVDPLFPSQPIDLVKQPQQALAPEIAAAIMYEGMERGSFRKGQTFTRYFDDDTDDPYTAREIINGDKTRVPGWSNGVSIGNLIKGYHLKFLDALKTSRTVVVPPIEPPIEPPIVAGKGIVRLEGDLEVWLNGVKLA
jgi:hypothetical protein